MQRKMIIFCAVIVVLCSIGVYVSAGKQKLSRGADKWINESVNVLTATSAWIENEYELHALKKQKLKDIFIEKADRFTGDALNVWNICAELPIGIGNTIQGKSSSL